MKKILFYPALLFFLITACSGKMDQQASAASSSKPKLNISASPRQGFAPLRITFRGQLEGVEPNDKEYYCLQEEWDYGDGAKSTEKPNCDPHTPDSKVKTEFFTEHVYERHGNYTVRLVLGDEKLRSRSVTVIIVERDRGLD